jgi:hypothetical protein
VSGPRHADRPDHVAEHVTPFTSAAGRNPAPIHPDLLEVAPGTLNEAIQGWVPQLATDVELRVALEKAFDYRGDVTVTLKNSSQIEGYIFDRVSGPTISTSFVRILRKDSNQRTKISYADIAALAFTGRDPAAGKSWEAWVRKYWEKKADGGPGASLEPESLE